MNAIGIIFSSINEKSIHELTKERTMASVPFGCRYRLIDFALSNMVNAGITHIGLITHYNYQSLMDHIGTGKDWDLARRHGGIKLLPPYITAFSNATNTICSTWLGALVNVRDFLNGCKEEYVVLSDCDSVCNLDLDAMIQQHISLGSDVTLAVKRVYIADGGHHRSVTVIDSDENGMITGVADSAGRPSGYADASLKLVVANKKYIENAINLATAYGYSDFYKDVILRGKDASDCRIYRYENYFATLRSLNDYFSCSMDLLDPEIRRSLFGLRSRPVLTKVRNSAPSSYVNGSVVRNSLIADGCVIEGTVENSIIFRGVKVGKNTTVKNCILMQDTITGDNAYLNCVITEKNVVIREGRVLSGHETMPFFIEKNAIV